MNNKYCIFSDESGSWNEKPKNGGFYIRSWVCFKQNDYESLEKKFAHFKENNKGIKNATLGLLTTKPDLANLIFRRFKPKILFTFTYLNEFYNRKFRARESTIEYVENAIQTLEKQVKKGYLVKIPKRVRTAINYVLFLYIYERYHLENALEKFLEKESNLFLSVDKPQFNQRDYKELFKIIPINNKSLKIVKFSECLGVQIADSLVKCLRKILDSDFSNEKFIKFYRTFILPYLDRYCNCAKGINKVFFVGHTDYEFERKLIKKFRKLNNE